MVTETWSRANRSTMVCKSSSPWAAARSSAASVPTTFNPRCRAIVTPSRSSINKRMAWSSDASDIASRSPASRCARAESTGCFRLTTSNHWRGCEIHARTIAGVFAWASSAFTTGGIKTLRYRFGRMSAAWSKYEVVQGVVSATIDCIYRPSSRCASRSRSMSSSVYSSSTPWLFRNASTSMRVS